jgi:hypothetical protein
LDKVVGALFHGRHGRFDGSVTRGDDEFGRGGVFFEGFEEFQAAHFRHFNVRYNQLEFVPAALFQGVPSVFGRDHPMPPLCQFHGQKGPEPGLVVHHQNMVRHGPAMGFWDPGFRKAHATSSFDRFILGIIVPGTAKWSKHRLAAQNA